MYSSRGRPANRPRADTAAMLFWALLASGQINMRKVDGWQTLATKLIDQPIDLATCTLKMPEITSRRIPTHQATAPNAAREIISCQAGPSTHETARIHHAARRRDGGMADIAPRLPVAPARGCRRPRRPMPVMISRSGRCPWRTSRSVSRSSHARGLRRRACAYLSEVVTQIQ